MLFKMSKALGKLLVLDVALLFKVRIVTTKVFMKRRRIDVVRRHRFQEVIDRGKEFVLFEKDASNILDFFNGVHKLAHKTFSSAYGFVLEKLGNVRNDGRRV